VAFCGRFVRRRPGAPGHPPAKLAEAVELYLEEVDGPAGYITATPLVTSFQLPRRRAGYADGQILPIGHPVWRFYRLVP
jgi:hypothetical protein